MKCVWAKLQLSRSKIKCLWIKRLFIARKASRRNKPLRNHPTSNQQNNKYSNFLVIHKSENIIMHRSCISTRSNRWIYTLKTSKDSWDSYLSYAYLEMWFGYIFIAYAFDWQMYMELLLLLLYYSLLLFIISYYHTTLQCYPSNTAVLSIHTAVQSIQHCSAIHIHTTLQCYPSTPQC